MPPALTTFLFEVANFLMLAGALTWLFFRPVQDAIERRRGVLQKQNSDAEAKLAEAERLRSEIKQRFAALDQELDEFRSHSRQAAELEAQQILAAARETSRRELEVRKRQLAKLERAQRERLARIIAETTGTTLDRMLRRLDHPDLEHALTRAACREIEAFDKNSLAPVRIESAHPLETEDRIALLNVLGAAGETAEFHVIDDLGTGLRVTTNRGLIDVSSRGLATFVESLLDSHLDLSDDEPEDQCRD